MGSMTIEELTNVKPLKACCGRVLQQRDNPRISLQIIETTLLTLRKM